MGKYNTLFNWIPKCVTEMLNIKLLYLFSLTFLVLNKNACRVKEDTKCGLLEEYKGIKTLNMEAKWAD